MHASLEMCTTLEKLNVDLQTRWGITLAMRIGIHTGPVMVSFLGERRGQDFVAVGDTVNLASRIQNAAPPGGVLLTHDTYRHVRGVFEIRALEAIQVKGKPDPILVYLALRAKRRAFRTASRGVEGLETSLVGRSTELSALQLAFETSVREGSSRLITISGDAGVGKSRLIAEFENWLDLLPQSISYFKGRTTLSMQNLPFSLLRDLFSFRFEIFDSDSPAVVQTKFEQGFASFPRGSQNEAGPASAYPHLPASHLVAAWLGFSLETSPALPAARHDPGLFQQRALAALMDFLHQAAFSRPVVILLEDLHWADDSSLDALEALTGGLPSLPMLIICTARPTIFERRPHWGKCTRPGEVICDRMDLQPLSAADSQHLIGELLRRCINLPESLRERIISSAEGNPFFIEELVNMLITDGVILTSQDDWRIDLSRLSSAHIPSTLTGVLQARLDGLSARGQSLLQRASVLGRVFWDTALAKLDSTPDPPEKLELDGLAESAMIYRNRSSTFNGTREYLFKHALLRDVAYESVLKRQRRLYHARAADWLQEVTGRSGRSNEWAALIADHWDRAGDMENARLWYHRAGSYAADHYANAEGIRCISRCLELWPPEDPAGRFDLLVQRLRIYDIVADRASQLQDVNELQSLAAQLESAAAPCADRAWSAEANLQKWYYHEALGDIEASYHAAAAAIKLAQACGAIMIEAQAGLLAGASAWRRSDWPVAREHLEYSLSLTRQSGFRKIEADCLRNLGIVVQYQGDRTAAQQYYSQALQIYTEMADERGQGMLLNSLGILAQERRLWEEAAEYFERSLEIKRKIGHQRAIHITTQNQAVLYMALERFDEARRLIKKVLEFSSEDGDRESQADCQLYLGDIDLRTGRLASVGPQLETALAIYREIGSPLGECQSEMVLSMLCNRLGDPASALSHAQAAISIAESSDLSRERALARVRSADTLLALSDPPSALAAYALSVDAFRAQDDHPGLLTALAGLARAHLATSTLPPALAAVNEILSLLKANEPKPPDLLAMDLAGLDHPFQILHTCLTVLRRADDPRVSLFAAHARQLLLERASRFESDDDRALYLAIPNHQEILNYSQ